MTIRTATISDIDGILEIQTQLLSLHYGAHPDKVDPAKIPLYYGQLKKYLEDSQVRIFVASDADKIIGHCIAQIRQTKDHAILRDVTRLEIQDLCVDRDYQLKGIGKALFMEAFTLAKGIGITRIEVGFWEFNKNAKQFYQHLGMKLMMSKLELQID